MANELTPSGTVRPLRIPASQTVTGKQKKVPLPTKKPKPDKKNRPDDDAKTHIDEYI